MMRVRTQNRKSGKKILGQALIDGFRLDFRMTDITNAFFALMGREKKETTRTSKMKLSSKKNWPAKCWDRQT